MKLIDKNALVEYLERMGNEIYAGNDEYFIGQKAGLMKVVGVIMTFPTVEERKHGHWEDIDLDTSVCSVCKKPQEYETKYCPECGAKMELMNEVLNAYAKADFRFAHALNVFQGLIDKAPTVEERKHGHWEDIDLDTSVCSVCKKPQEYETKYCPECGAKMENNGDDDDE